MKTAKISSSALQESLCVDTTVEHMIWQFGDCVAQLEIRIQSAKSFDDLSHAHLDDGRGSVSLFLHLVERLERTLLALDTLPALLAAEAFLGIKGLKRKYNQGLITTMFEEINSLKTIYHSVFNGHIQSQSISNLSL